MEHDGVAIHVWYLVSPPSLGLANLFLGIFYLIAAALVFESLQLRVTFETRRYE